MPALLCLGCGEDLAHRAADRRALQGLHAEGVVAAWKTVFKTVRVDVEDSDMLCADTLLAGGKMCRSCFSGYERFSKLHKTLHDNITRAFESQLSQEAQQEQRKRPRVEKRDTSYAANLPSQSGESRESPSVSVRVGYKRPRTFVLTPQRKHLGKAVARRSKKAIAAECMRDHTVQKHILKLVGKMVHAEIKKFCSDSANSILTRDDPQCIKTFSWESLNSEISKFAPVLKGIFQATCKARVNKTNFTFVMCVCVALLLRNRNPRMNLIQKIISLVLYGGHSSKQTYTRLQRLNLTVSHKSLIRLVNKVGSTFDEKATKWRDGLLKLLHTSETSGHPCDTGGSTPLLPEEKDDFEDLSSSDESDNSDSDISFLSFSPVTSDDEYYSSSDSSKESDGSGDDEEDSHIDSDDSRSFQSCDDDGANTSQLPQSPSITPLPAQQEASLPHSVDDELAVPMYTLCGDNIDKIIRHRYLRCDSTANATSLHYFHFYAVKDRIDFSDLREKAIPCDVADPLQLALSLLPSPEDDMAIRRNICILISRILYSNNLEYFKVAFDGVVEWHIEHPFYQEMSKKSDVVPLGIIPKNETKMDEMVDIMAHMHQYVPIIESSEEVYVPSLDEKVELCKARCFPIIIAGDQLTAARARGAKEVKCNSVSPTSRFEGLIPTATDWHTKQALLGIIWKSFYSLHSAGDHGTLYQLRNRIHRSNVPNVVKKDFNACEDFIDTVISSHIVAAAMATFQLKSTSDTPSDSVLKDADQVWMKGKEERKAILEELCMQVFDKFISLSFGTTSSNYIHSAGDGVSSYSIQLLRIGCLYMEFADAIREGDGERVIRCWRYFMPVFRAANCINYACESFNLLYQHSYALSPRLSSQLMWSRFINVHGRPGRNIPLDLHIEHLNRLAKDAIQNLGSNKTVGGVARVGRCIGTLSHILDKCDRDILLDSGSSKYRKPHATKDIAIVVEELVSSQAFSIQEGRRHKHYPRGKDLLESIPRKKLLDWMMQRLKQYV